MDVKGLDRSAITTGRGDDLGVVGGGMRDLTLAVGTVSPGRVERGDRFDLDNEIGTRWQRRPGYGAARRLRTKIADEHIAVLSV